MKFIRVKQWNEEEGKDCYIALEQIESVRSVSGGTIITTLQGNKYFTSDSAAAVVDACSTLRNDPFVTVLQAGAKRKKEDSNV